MSRLPEIWGFEVLETLGYGANSTIFAVKDKDQQVYAMKQVIRKSEKDQRFVDQALREHEVASKINHPNLRRSYRVIRQRRLFTTTEVVVLLEMVDGHLLEHHKPGDIVELCGLFEQVAGGLSAMHQAGWVHSDIKPINILVTGNNAIKIIDFGQSCRTGTVKERIQGTPDYIAPEQVRKLKITAATDVFNLGASIYWMLTGKYVPTMIPRKGDQVKRKGERPRCKPPHEVNPEVPTALSALVMDCIKPLPKQRPSMAAVQDRLRLAIIQDKHRKKPGNYEIAS